MAKHKKNKKRFSSKVGSYIDNLIAIASPERALKRHIYRSKFDNIRSSYSAASNNRMTSTWSPGNSSINDIINSSRQSMNDRVRQLIRDFPYFSRAIDAIVNYTVGSGIIFQSRVADANGKLNKRVIQKIEDVFNFWAEEADYSGNLHYYELMQLAKRQDVESGEFLIIKRYVNNAKYMPYKLQIIEPDWLAYDARVINSENDIEQGVEYNKITGEVKAIHISDPYGLQSSERIPAENFIHKFKTLRPGQLRGVTAFASGIMLANSLHGYMEDELDKQHMASKYLAFVKTVDPTGRQLGLGVETDTDTQQKIDNLENCIIDYLRPDEEVQFADSNLGSNFPPMIRLLLTMLSVSTNVPYEILSGDYQGLNYSTGKMVRNDFKQFLRPISARHIRHFCTSTFDGFLDNAVMAGKLNFRNYFNSKHLYAKSEWQIPGMESIEPFKEGKANIENLNNKLTSDFELARQRGRNLEDIYRELKRAKDLRKQYGIEDVEIDNDTDSVSNLNSKDKNNVNDKDDDNEKEKK